MPSVCAGAPQVLVLLHIYLQSTPLSEILLNFWFPSIKPLRIRHRKDYRVSKMHSKDLASVNRAVFLPGQSPAGPSVATVLVVGLTDPDVVEWTRYLLGLVTEGFLLFCGFQPVTVAPLTLRLRSADHDSAGIHGEPGGGPVLDPQHPETPEGQRQHPRAAPCPGSPA